jgi:hypothetical protein
VRFRTLQDRLPKQLPLEGSQTTRTPPSVYPRKLFVPADQAQWRDVLPEERAVAGDLSPGGLHYRSVLTTNQLQQLAMDHLIACADRPLGQHLCAAICVGHEAPRLFDDDNSGRNIPSLQISLPKAVIAT